MDNEYELAKASFESAGIQPGNADFTVNEGGVSVETPIEAPEISTTEVSQSEGTSDTPTAPSEPETEGQGAPKVEAPKTVAQKKEASAYQKAQEEKSASKIREAEAWKKINEAKAETAKQAQYWKDVAEGRVPAPEREPTEPVFISPLDGKKFTAAQLREAEALFLEQGRDVDAQNAAKIAEHLEQTTVQAQQQQFAQQQHFSTWQQNMEYATRIDPSLLDPKNPLTAEISQLLDYPDPLVRGVFESHPHGFYLAAEVGKVRHALNTEKARADKAEAELAKVKSGKAALEQKIMPRPAPAPGRVGDRIPTEEEELAAARQEYNSLH